MYTEMPQECTFTMWSFTMWHPIMSTQFEKYGCSCAVAHQYTRRQTIYNRLHNDTMCAHTHLTYILYNNEVPADQCFVGLPPYSMNAHKWCAVLRWSAESQLNQTALQQWTLDTWMLILSGVCLCDHPRGLQSLDLKTCLSLWVLWFSWACMR